MPSNLDFLVTPSEDRRAFTVRFANALVSIEAARHGQAGRPANQTAMQTKVFTLHIPYATTEPRVPIRVVLRGIVSPEQATAGVHTRLVVCAEDTTHVVNLAENTRGDFTESFVFSVQPHAGKPVCQITLFLLVEHDTDSDRAGEALLIVDSLNLEMNLDLGMPGTGTFTV